MTQALLNSAELTNSQFSSISHLVKELCGINLHDGKMALVKARLNKRLRTLGLSNFGQYMEIIRNDAGGNETTLMLDALSTNLTYFFREPQHLEYLRAKVMPAIVRRHARDRRLRIWSAGCSSGEEPYSVAMIVRDVLGETSGWDVGILASDLSRRMLATAMEGVYSADRLRQIPSRLVVENFTCLRGGGHRCYRVNEPLRKMVNFARLNLVEPWPMRGQFDVIFCRNVMIYFDKPTQARIIERFWNQLLPGGTLFIGHSESLAGVRHLFNYVQPTIYEKPHRP